MKKYRFGKTSNRRKKTIHPVGRKLLDYAISHPDCPCDFGIITGFRGEKEQNEAYAGEKSNAKWGESDHNFMIGPFPCSLAFDIGPYDSEINDYVWDQNDRRHERLAKHIFRCANNLGLKVSWGGTYEVGRNKSKDKFHWSLKLI